MTFDFDHEIDRRGTDCLKYDFAEERGYGADVLPLWIADMDFQAPPCVRQALAQAVAHGIFGYSDTKFNNIAAARALTVPGSARGSLPVDAGGLPAGYHSNLIR